MCSSRLSPVEQGAAGAWDGLLKNLYRGQPTSSVPSTLSTPGREEIPAESAEFRTTSGKRDWWRRRESDLTRFSETGLFLHFRRKSHPRNTRVPLNTRSMAPNQPQPTGGLSIGPYERQPTTRQLGVVVHSSCGSGVSRHRPRMPMSGRSVTVAGASAAWGHVTATVTERSIYTRGTSGARRIALALRRWAPRPRGEGEDSRRRVQPRRESGGPARFWRAP